jgi:hypothetical protein
MSAIATIQVTTMEFVIGKPNGRAISTALWGSGDMLSPSTARAMPRRRWSRLFAAFREWSRTARRQPMRGNAQDARF